MRNIEKEIMEIVKPTDYSKFIKSFKGLIRCAELENESKKDMAEDIEKLIKVNEIINEEIQSL